MSLDRRKTPEQLEQDRLSPIAVDIAKALHAMPHTLWPKFIDEALHEAFVACQLSLLEYLLQDSDSDAMVERARIQVRKIKDELAAREAVSKTLEERLEEAREEISGARQLARKRKTDDVSEIPF